MSLRLIVSAAFALFALTAQAEGPAPAISYTRDIQPIFTEKCVACHACYDSACQLNLGSAEGAARGATKVPVYDGFTEPGHADDAPVLRRLWQTSLAAKGFLLGAGRPGQPGGADGAHAGAGA